MKYIKTYDEFQFLNENKVVYFNILESLASARKLFLNTNKIPDNIFNNLIEIDPSPSKKYLEKICKFYLEKPDIDLIKNLIVSFDSLVNKHIFKGKDSDINSYKSFQDFQNVIEGNKDKKSKTEIEKNIKRKDAEIILNNDKFLIISPLTHEAACIYGSGTKWCITEKTPRYWDSYVKKDIKFYFILNKHLDESDPMYKIAVSVYLDGRKEVYNAIDEEIYFKKIESLGLKEDLFKPESMTIEKYLKKWIKGSYTIDEDGFCNVNGNVKITNQSISKLPVKFNKVSGYFYCSENKFISLEGFPQEVGGNFDCSENELVSLKYGPKEVGKDFNCSHNKLTSLEGCPQKVGGNFDCENNKLTSLEGGPEEVNGYFICTRNILISLKGGPKKVSDSYNCSENKLISLEGSPKEIFKNFDCNDNQLISLKGGPEKIKQNFNCARNKLISLEGSPKIVGGDFYCVASHLISLKGGPEKIKQNFNCAHNELTSLEGSSKEVGENFYCHDNNLISLEDIPKKIGRDFNCRNNKLNMTEEEIRKLSDIKGKILI